MRYLFLIFFLYSSCVTEKSLSDNVEGSFINVDGNFIEIVLDEYDNPYLKQKTVCGIVYIPFTFPTEDDEIPRIYETNKPKKYGTSSK